MRPNETLLRWALLLALQGCGGTSGGDALTSVADELDGEPAPWTHSLALPAQDPSVSVGPDGVALAAWSQAGPPHFTIQARWLLADAANVPLSDPSVESWMPKVAVDGAHRALAVWLQYDGGIRAHLWARRFGAGAWGPAVQLSLNTLADAASPDLACDLAGNAVAVWHEGSGAVNHFDVHAARFTATTGSWSVPFLLSDGINSAYNPRISMNGSGDALTVWTQDEGDGSLSNGPRDTWARAYQATQWAPAVLLNSVSGATSGVYGQVALAVNSSGSGVALWIQQGASGTGPYQVWSAAYTPGAGWGSALGVSTPGIGDTYWPDVALDSSGTAVAVWEQQNGVSSAIATSRLSPGGIWTSPQTLSSGSDAFEVRVAIDASGQATAIWYQQVPTGFTIWSAATSGGGSWSSPLQIDAFIVDPFLYFPVVRIAAKGSSPAVLVWGLDGM